MSRPGPLVVKAALMSSNRSSRRARIPLVLGRRWAAGGLTDRRRGRAPRLAGSVSGGSSSPSSAISFRCKLQQLSRTAPRSRRQLDLPDHVAAVFVEQADDDTALRPAIPVAVVHSGDHRPGVDGPDVDGSMVACPHQAARNRLQHLARAAPASIGLAAVTRYRRVSVTLPGDDRVIRRESQTRRGGRAACGR